MQIVQYSIFSKTFSKTLSKSFPKIVGHFLGRRGFCVYLSAAILSSCGYQTSLDHTEAQILSQMQTIQSQLKKNGESGLSFASNIYNLSTTEHVARKSVVEREQFFTQIASAAHTKEEFSKVWGDLQPHQFTEADQRRTLSVSLSKHVNPTQNGSWPKFLSIEVVLRNSDPAYVFVPTDFAEKLEIEWIVLNNTSVALVKLVDVHKAVTEKKLQNSDLYQIEKNVQSALSKLSESQAETLVNFINDFIVTHEIRTPQDPYDKIFMTHGFLMGLDPHSGLITKKSMDDALSGTKKVVGLGIWFKKVDEGLFVNSLVPGGAGEGLGLRYGDVVVAINGERVDLKMKSVTAYSEMILGDEGTIIEITVKRKGVETRYVAKRIAFDIKDVESKDRSKALYMRLSHFANNSAKRLHSVISEKKESSPLIVDLRNNGGGLLWTALQSVSLFVAKSSQPIFYQFSRPGFSGFARADSSPAGRAFRNPLVILVNEESASASEILSAAAKDFGRAIVIGKQTYGKGTVQESFDVTPELMCRYTNSYFFIGSHFTPQFVGVTPHVVVDKTLAQMPANEDGMRHLVGALRPIKGQKEHREYASRKLNRNLTCIEDHRPKVIEKFKEIEAKGEEEPDLQLLMADQAVECLATVGGL